MLGASIAGAIGGVRAWGGGGAKQLRGEQLWLLYSKLFVRSMHGVTKRISLN